MLRSSYHYILVLLASFYCVTVHATDNSAVSSGVWKLVADSHDSFIVKDYDSLLQKEVVKFGGVVSLKNSGGSGVNLYQALSAESTIAEWKMRLAKGYQVSFLLQTPRGIRQLTYTPGTKVQKVPGKNIYQFGLGVNSASGEWLQFKRNLSQDLQRFEPDNRVTAIRFALLKGSGAVTDIGFRKGPIGVSYSQKRPERPSTAQPSVQLTKAVESRSDITSPAATVPAGEPVIAAVIPGSGGVRRMLSLPKRAENVTPEVKVDGYVTEPVWHTAPVANDFRVTEKRIQPSDTTEVRVTSDDRHLYFAFRCYDENPGLITAIKTRRDGGLGTDDAISVSIDSYKNFTTAATYSINAIGTRNDQLPGGSSKKIQWKGDWRGAAVKTDYGWSAEIAIPFDILNFSAGSDSFGINFSRYHHRTAQTSNWVKPATEKQSDPLGLLSGLVLPQKKSGRVLTMMPYVVAGKNIVNRDGELKDKSAHGGLTVKYEPRNNFTGLVEIYPDFSQIESQISDIDFSYNEKEVDDNRTFFQEGSAYFGTDSQYFYSPRIADFDIGAKTFMQNESSVLGFLATKTVSGRSDLHARYRQKLSEQFGVTLSAVGGDDGDARNALLAVGVDQRLDSGLFYNLSGAVAQDDLIESDDISRSGKLVAGLARNQWEIGINSDYFTADYRPRTALINSDLPGTRSNGVYASIYKEGGGYIKEINSNITLSKRDSLTGEEQNSGVYLSTDFEVFGKSRLQFSYSQYDYRPVSDTPGVFLETINEDKYWSTNLDLNIYSPRFGYGAFAADGTLGGGEYRYLSGYLWFNPTNSTNLKLSTEDLESFGRYRQTTLSGGWDISKTDGLIARLSRGDGYRQLRLAYRRKVSSGIDVFLSYQKQNDIDDEYTGKLVWTY